jgi:SnoaL-like domain
MNNIQIRCLQMLVLLIATALMLVACINLALIPSAAPPMDSLSMVDAFHDAVNSEDVDAVLALFADDATVTDNGLVIEGRRDIRSWILYSQRMTGLRLTLFHSEQNEENIIWLDKAHNGSEVQNRYYILRWEALIRDGKIQSLAAMPRYWPDLK